MEPSLIDDYVPLKLLGKGGYGEVFLAVHKALLWKSRPDLVALKLLTGANMDLAFESEGTSRKGKETLRERFRREANALEKLSHPNIVKPVHHRLDGDQPYIAMEVVSGKTLEAIIGEHPRGMTPAEAMRYLGPMCEALDYAHSQNPPILHRDMKPSNVMINAEGTVKVMDFGLSYTIGDTNLTMSADWVGTPAYASPDSFMKLHAPALDQYTIGLIAFELLTGKTANPESDPLGAIQAALGDSVQRLSVVRPDLGGFAQAVDRLYARDPVDRFASLGAALKTLQKELARL